LRHVYNGEPAAADLITEVGTECGISLDAPAPQVQAEAVHIARLQQWQDFARGTTGADERGT
jgi:hypothetical protein